MDTKKLLIVEDDPNLGQILKEYLEIKGYDTELCVDGEMGLKAFKKERFDLCILDIMLPKKDGFSLAKDLNELDAGTPFIFLTAKNMKHDTINGFKIGADDYITKPFSMEELLLRMKVILKRSTRIKAFNKQIFKLGKFEFNYDLQILSFEGDVKKLTSKESDLLKMLCQHLNETLNRSTALKTIWKDDTYFNARSMDVYITKLRKLLKPDLDLKILTIHGQGFRLVNVK